MGVEEHTTVDMDVHVELEIGEESTCDEGETENICTENEESTIDDDSEEKPTNPKEVISSECDDSKTNINCDKDDKIYSDNECDIRENGCIIEENSNHDEVTKISVKYDDGKNPFIDDLFDESLSV